MGFYQDQILPHLIHLAMRSRYLVPYRERIVSEAEGRVLEVLVSDRTVTGRLKSPDSRGSICRTTARRRARFSGLSHRPAFLPWRRGGRTPRPAL